MLAPEAPYPLAGGGALRTASLLQYLARSYEVHLIVFQQPGAPDPTEHLPPGLVHRMSVIPLPANGRSLAARAVRNAGRVARGIPPLVDRFSGFATSVERALEGRRYSIGIVEHSWCAPYWPQISQACDRTILDLHNIESTLHARSATVERDATSFAHHIFRRASLELEREWLPRFSQVLATSDRDAELARSIAPTARVSVYPNAIPAIPLPEPGDENAIVFSGNMEYHPNRSAVRYFRRDVWPQLRERWPGLVWRLVGKNPEAVRQFTIGDSRIEVQGQVAHAVPELARAKLAVVPLLAGSGTRLKVLEAWAAGLPVVSTSVGAEGLPVREGEHILLADTAVTFADAVSRLLASNALRSKLGAAGRLLLEKEFTWDKAWGKLDF
jgi:glycosyltransferase involved in cell wall biosynthesis